MHMQTNKVRRACLPVLLALTIGGILQAGSAQATQTIVVALGASQTYGRGVSRGQDYPAQLEELLRAKGRDVRVINAGVSDETTKGMLNRLDKDVPAGTKVVILQPGGNDKRDHQGGDREGNIAEISSRLQARHIKMIMMENNVFRDMPRGIDGQHLTPDGYHKLAVLFMPQVLRAIGK